uniref:CACN subunit beta associated regulatory protein n=1 Tax=Paramormyrops kingsleyae TaxID=1676925 RepID=A0A3B3SG85_9TELE|nr:voltage-dependent calcium channel beta subunit-associated regulatory protein [Paramormyrops kingsleyae]
MSNESTLVKNLTDDATDLLHGPGGQDGYVLLLVLLCVFVGGTLLLLSVLLILCRRCCEGGRRYSRASDDPEKTNTTYVEEYQPVPEITIRVDEEDCLSSSSGQDVKTECFLSTGSTGRRVSFNESALFDHGRKAQEKGRRYTLTEGDFHHLKNARLTNLHLPPPALKILTIPESPEQPSSKPKLSIFQPPVRVPPQTAMAKVGLGTCSGLPGDALNSTADADFDESFPIPDLRLPHSRSIDIMEAQEWNGSSPGIGVTADGTTGAMATAASSQGTVLQIFTKLRRHASLEGISPYFRIKKWKFDSIQRASSLDVRGSPKRHQFQRQRAASESTDQDEHSSPHLDFIQHIARVQHRAPTSTLSPSLGRLEAGEVAAASSNGEAGVKAGPSESQEEEELLSGGGPSHGCQETTEHLTLYRDIWTLRASLEQYASSEQSSNNDRDSVRSDAGSVSSLGGGAAGGALASYPSQDTGDELEVELPSDVGRGDRGRVKQDSVDSERGSDSEAASRKLLQMDSGYASIEAPSRAPEDARLFAPPGGGKGKTASEKRHFFTNSGRKVSVCESFEMRLSEEELEDEAAAGATAGGCSPADWSPHGETFGPRDSSPLPRFRRRDYSIDEKTDALFNEFLRHDPQFDQQESPVRQKHRSRVHLRKQWQRTKQYSDPGMRLPALGMERQRGGLRRGDSATYPLDVRYHSKLSRIVSAADEEGGEGTGEIPSAEAQEERSKVSPDGGGGGASDSPPPASEQGEPPRPGSPGTGYGPQMIVAELTDKLALGLDDRLYRVLQVPKGSSECIATAVSVSPDHSPV